MLDITITFTINKTDYKTYESIITDFESDSITVLKTLQHQLNH